MCEDFTLNFAAKELAVASQHNTVLHFFFHQGIFDQKAI
jgi:hypothetical protein